MFEYFKEHSDEFREKGRDENQEELILNIFIKRIML